MTTLRNAAGLAALCAALSPSGGRAESLAEAAAREKARRKGGPVKVFGEDDLKSARGSTATGVDGHPVGLYVHAGRTIGRRRSILVHFEDKDYPPLSGVDTERIRREAPGQGLLDRLKSQDHVTSQTACQSLDAEAVGRHAPELLATLQDARAPSAARQCAGFVLAALTPATPGLSDSLIGALRDQDMHVRRVAVEVVTWVSVSDRVLVGLAGALQDPAYLVRGNSAVVLGELGPSAVSAVPALVRAVQTQWPQQPAGHVRAARLRMVQALGQMGPGARAAIPALTQLSLAEDGDPPTHSLVKAADRALAQIGR